MKIPYIFHYKHFKYFDVIYINRKCFRLYFYEKINQSVKAFICMKQSERHN